MNKSVPCGNPAHYATYRTDILIPHLCSPWKNSMGPICGNSFTQYWLMHPQIYEPYFI